MRTILSEALTAAVARLCVQANTQLPADVTAALNRCRQSEPWPLARETMGLLQDNLIQAKERDLPICQDTGMACVFVELGQEVHIQGDFERAIHQGVRQGYGEGCLRKSIVGDPLRRVNTGDNTPASITVRLTPGDRCTVTVVPKGFGSENMSRLAMLKPADGLEGVKRFVVETVRLAGPNPCPPTVLGIGVGGSFDKVAALAKEMWQEGFEAVIVSCAGDPGVAQARKEIPIPVIGAGESTAALALYYGQRPAALGITQEVPAGYQRAFGDKLLASGRGEGVESTLDLMTDAGYAATAEAARGLKALGADVIALSCTGMSTIQIAPALEEDLGIPVLDPVMCEGLMALFQLLRRKK